MSKRIISVCFDDELIDAIDELRGNTPRSRYLGEAIRYVLSLRSDILQGDSSCK